MEIHISKKGKYFGPLPQLYVGRPSPLGNPYSAKEHGLDKALELYSLSLKNLNHAQVKMLGVISDKARNGGIVLTCWCKDEFNPTTKDHSCHAELIRNYLKGG